MCSRNLAIDLATDRAIAEAASGPGKQTAVNKKKCLYIALLKALVRKRMED